MQNNVENNTNNQENIEGANVNEVNSNGTNVETIGNTGGTEGNGVDPKKEKKDDEKKKDHLWFKIVAFIVVVIIIILLLLRGCGGETSVGDPDTSSSSDTSSKILIDDSAIQGKEETDTAAIQEELNKKVAASMINISMATEVTFENSKSEGVVNIYNEEINNYPQVVEIIRDDTEEVIYKSGAIPVGSRIDTAKLQVDLEKGDYECTAYFTSVDIETGESLGKAGAKIEVHILN